MSETMKLLLSVLLLVSLSHLSEGTQDPSILISDEERSEIVKLSLSTGEVETVIKTGSYAGAFEYDPVEKEIYWSDVMSDQIMKSNLEGTTHTVVANISARRYGERGGDKIRPARAVEGQFQNGGDPRVTGLALDSAERKLFYTVSDNNEIVVVDLETGLSETLLNNSYMSQRPGNIVADEENRRLYWSGGEMFSAFIASADYNGSNAQMFVQTETESPFPYVLAFDKLNKVLYWGDSGFGEVRARQVDGQEEKAILSEYYATFKGLFFNEDMVYVNNVSYPFNRSLYYIPADGGNKTYVDVSPYTANAFYIINDDGLDQFRPEVYLELVHTGDTTSELVFHCNFSQQDQATSYRTNWFVDGQLVTTTPAGQWSNGDIIDTQALKESQLKTANISTFGIQVSCSVDTVYAEGNVTTSPLSFQKFVGIAVSKSPSTLTQGQEGEIQVEMTAPFGCGRTTPPSQCQLVIEVIPTQNPTDCNEATLMPSACGGVFKADKWSDPITLTVFGKITSNYGSLNKAVNLKLRTAVFSQHDMWGNYELTIEIVVSKRSKFIQRKSCSSVNDPHLKTFDGRRYEHQYGGIFTMYKHALLPVEVQIQTFNCGGRSSDIWCNCGVAVRAGRTVFEMNRCPGQSDIWTMDYTLCEDGEHVLEVKRNWRNYEIYLPTGGMVQVSAYDKFLNIQIYPSVLDVEKSLGLCGNLSESGVCSDDFVLRDGSYSTDPTSTDDCRTASRVWQNVLVLFSESWRVPQTEDLFNHENYASLSAWPKQSIFCTCPAPSGGTGPLGQPVCTADQSRETCKSLPGFTDVASTSCSVGGKRRRRSTKVFSETPRREKRGTVMLTWPDGWTEASAKAHCEELFQNSSSVQVCDGVEGVQTNESIESCIMDIYLTGLTDFGVYSIDEVRSKCLHEIVSDPELSNKTSESDKSVYDVIIAQACPSDCNGKGTCTEGSCECQTNYGGEDCSIDLRVPPNLVQVEADGHCDTAGGKCEKVSAYGEVFVEQGAKCLFEKIKVTESSQESSGSSSVTALTQSISQVQCELPQVEAGTGSDTDYVMAYRVSVANSGEAYSESLGLMVYDSTCIKAEVNGTTFKWTLEGSYCVYRGMCVADKAKQPGDSCRVCDAAKRTWTTDGSCQGSAFPVVPVTVGVIGGAVVLIAIAIVAYICVKKRTPGRVVP